MTNESIFIASALGIFGFVLYCFFRGRRWLHAAVAVNLLLISVFGAKLIPLFGSVTNVGNIFYAAVFFAGQLLVEHYGRDEGRKSIWLGFASVAFFVLVGRLTVAYIGIPESVSATAAIATLFEFTPRVAIASLLAYLCSQSLNMRLYSYLREQRPPKIWLRSISANAGGQLVDSALFFSLAFWGSVPAMTLFGTIVTGFTVKFLVGLLGAPLLYASYRLRTKKEILEEEAEAILLGIGDGLVITDREGKIVMVNRACRELLGFEESDMIGKPMTEVVVREDEAGNRVSYLERVLTEVLVGEKHITPMARNTYFVRKNGTRFPVRIVVTPVLIDRAVMGAVEVFHDVTEEKELERLRRDFLSLASHQLRTPLSGTRWLIETLKRGILGDMNERQKEYVDNLYQINGRMLQLVSDMLQVLQIEGGGIVVAKERFPLTRLCEGVTAIMQIAAKNQGIVLERPLAQRSPILVETDFKLAKMIVESFVANAINYSHPGGRVALDGAEFPNEVVFSVQDHGIGIPDDERKKVFERFYRTSNAKLMKPDGTGLGLYIASVLAEKIGATITFESKEGKGSTFYLHLPKPSV